MNGCFYIKLQWILDIYKTRAISIFKGQGGKNLFEFHVFSNSTIENLNCKIYCMKK